MKNTVNFALIESYIGKNFLSYTEFCKRCDISMTTFSKIRRGANVRMTAFVKIARTIGVPLKNLFEDICD